ncbi:hypothetical protein LPJ66_005100, partial [Kickxella alabastrina]
MSYNYNNNNYDNSAYQQQQGQGYAAPPPQQQYGGYYDNNQYQPPQQQPPPPQSYQYQQQQPETYYPPPPPPADVSGYSAGDFKGAKQYNRTPKFRDLWAALLFIAHLALYIVMAALFIRSLPSSAFKNSGNLSFTKDFYSWPTMIMWLIVLLTSIVFSVIYLGVLQ